MSALGVPVQGGLLPGGRGGIQACTDRCNDRCKNITFATSLWTVNYVVNALFTIMTLA